MMKTYFFAIRSVERYTTKAAEGLAEAVRLHREMYGNYPIKSILVPADIPGVIIVEACYKHEVISLLRGIKHTRGLMSGKLSLKEVYDLATPDEDILESGSMIEVIEGPFKQSKGRVIKDDGAMVTVEILDWDRTNRISLRKSQLRKLES